MSPINALPDRLPAHAGLAYGLLGLPLAFVALPLYVHLPKIYAQQFGLPLATLGAVLLLARTFDAFTDPWLGRLNDQLFARSHRWVLGAGAVAALCLLAGVTGLFFPPWPLETPDEVFFHLLLGMVLTTAAYSWLAIAHQAWGARWGGSESKRAHIVAWREGAGLVGVVLAASLPAWLDWSGWVTVLGVALALGWLAWSMSAPPNHHRTGQAPTLEQRHWQALWRPWQQPAFRQLMLVFLLSGLASAMPATLVLFFIQDKLNATTQEPLFLATYFVAAAVSLPLWMQAVKRIGLARTWLVGMLTAVVVFIGAASLGAGDVVGFWWVCALSGLALGTDLALPGALLTGVIQTASDGGEREGAYFGWWNLAAKFNLALAAGVSLPLLAWLGYEPGHPNPEGLTALTVAYAVLPCGLKLLAASSLYWFLLRPSRKTGVYPSSVSEVS